MDEQLLEHEHYNNALYQRYHCDVWLPENVMSGASLFLPPPGTRLNLSRHYQEIQADRRLPRVVNMPARYEIIDVTIIRDTWAVFRVLIRFPWYWKSKKRAIHDLALVLEGDYTIVTAFWIRQEDKHETLDVGLYEQPPVEQEVQVGNAVN